MTQTLTDLLNAAARRDEGDTVNPPGEPMPNVRAFLADMFDHEGACTLIHQGGVFYRWDGSAWPMLEDPILRAQLYRYFDGKFYVDGRNMKPFAPTYRKVADLLDACQAQTIIPTATPTPSWITEGDWPADEMIACSNGLIHWPSRTLHPHTPAYYCHHAVPFAFDPNAPAPARWLSFLNDLWGDDTDTIAVLQQTFGYLVSGDTRQQKMFLLIGPKRGGKGTIARVLTRMMGRHNIAGPTLASLGTNFGLQDLIGKPVAVVSDARIGGKSDASLIAERLLSVSGEDLQNVDRKYLPPWSGYLATRFVVLTNELPKFTDASGALASRFVIMLLSKSFYDQENPGLTEELCEELPGIFNWSLDGLQKLRARGRFDQPAASAAALRDLEDLSSPVGAFVRDRCKVGPGATVERDRLYREYRMWCEDDGHRPAPKQTFGRDLRAARPEIRSTRPRTGGPDRPRSYVGITLLGPLDRVDQGEDDDEVVQAWSASGPHTGPHKNGGKQGVVHTVHTGEVNSPDNGPCPRCNDEGCDWCSSSATEGGV